MPDSKPDRRVQRTEQTLREALVSLILEKGYDAITIQDLLDRANMGRSTFYAHYRDKEDLLLSGFQVLFDEFQKEFIQTAPESADPVQAGKDLSLFFFRHAGGHRNLYKAMIGKQGGKVILEHAQKYLTQLIGDHLAAQLSDHQQDLPIEVLAHFMASSYLSLITWWLDHNQPYTPEEMDTLFQRLVFPGIRSVLEVPPNGSS
ncbi:MAG TPA: TetR/AcrR family transcriptional regulator [Anaerolineales bacterium]|nr:TetR/AcrR family transcriptional regulator [Anaerolineales bacterium]